jgi:hypothetical protein
MEEPVVLQVNTASQEMVVLVGAGETDTLGSCPRR